MVFCSSINFGEIGEMGIPPWPTARVALSCTKGLHLLNPKLLCDLDDERHPLFSLTAVETDHGMRVMGGSSVGAWQRRGQSLVKLWLHEWLRGWWW
jgi:hypothetical protein